MTAEQTIFGEWLKSRRQEARVTQDDAAASVGVTRAMWAKWEAGDSLPRRDKMGGIAKVLEAAEDEAFSMAGYLPPGRRVDPRWKEFGDWLRNQREKARVTSTDAAEAAGITLTQWSRIETGASGTRQETIPRIAVAVNANLFEAYRRAGFVPPTSREREPDADRPETLEAQLGFDSMTDEEKRLAEAFIKGLRARRLSDPREEG